ncbi:MAG: hypothetical protein JO277_07045 [Candidatus Eremiobacteraeota bacterium]|nr:hypothetical protein [Candidatus Eremiobacteraeota bacterium]
MFHLPTLQSCEGLPLWLTGADDLTEALVLWWPSGTAWVVHGPSEPIAPPNHTDHTNHMDAA